MGFEDALEGYFAIGRDGVGAFEFARGRGRCLLVGGIGDGAHREVASAAVTVEVAV